MRVRFIGTHPNLVTNGHYEAEDAFGAWLHLKNPSKPTEPVLKTDCTVFGEFGAESTWGEGPDVLLTIPYEPESGVLLCLHGRDALGRQHSSIGLTSQEALDLACQLIKSAKTSLDMDISIRDLNLKEKQS